ncbi:MAG TPA: PaaI family thioesterase [Ktedonobacterales bacterium]|nr:PaaI family thioesterase [Ktedonobacterales bacterium]
MTAFEAQDPDFERRVRESFARQRVMETMGATLLRVTPGEVEIALPFRAELTQQHGFLHAGVVTTIVDSACGYAALSLMPPGAGVLTIEFKLNLMAPAAGERMIARGRVTKPGRTINVCAGDVFAEQDGREKLVATMLATVMTIHNRPGVTD